MNLFCFYRIETNIWRLKTFFMHFQVPNYFSFSPLYSWLSVSVSLKTRIPNLPVTLCSRPCAILLSPFLLSSACGDAATALGWPYRQLPLGSPFLSSPLWAIFVLYSKLQDFRYVRIKCNFVTFAVCFNYFNYTRLFYIFTYISCITYQCHMIWPELWCISLQTLITWPHICWALAVCQVQWVLSILHGLCHSSRP